MELLGLVVQSPIKLTQDKWGPGQTSNLSQIEFVEPIYFEIGAWMVGRLLQLNSTQINWYDSSMGSTCQVG